MTKVNQTHILNEVGDLGLGLYPINETSQEESKKEKDNKEE